MTTTSAPALRYVISVDGVRFVESADYGVAERTIEQALRRGRSDSVEVLDRTTGEVETYRVERRVSVDRRKAERGEDRRQR